MKIGIIFPKDSEAIFDTTSKKTFGGASVQMYAIAEELVRMNEHDIFSIVPKFTNIPVEHVYEKWNIREVFEQKKSILQTIFSFHKIIRQEKPEVLIQHGLTVFSCLLAVYCKLYKIKFVFMFAHNVEVDGRYQSSQEKSLLFWLLLRYSTVLIVQNQTQKTRLTDRYGVYSFLMYMGFKNIKNKTAQKDIVLWIARCDSWKQPEIFIKLVKSIPSQKFVMLCPAVDSEYFLKIKEMTNQVSNLEFIDFLPFHETWNYFERAKIFVNTSTHEGFPQTFVQAVSCGVPIVSLTVDPDTFISKYQCGIVCEGNENKLFNSVQNLIDDKELLFGISQNAFKYGANYHSIHLSVSKLISEISYV